MLRNKIQEEMKSALKAAQKDRLLSLRTIWNAVRNKEIDLKKDLDDEQIIGVINNLVKQTRDSLEQFQAGNRQDLVDKTKKEIDVLLSFLPQQLIENEINQLIEEAMRETSAAVPADMGKVMKALMPKIKGKADGKMVSKLVGVKLGA